MRRADQRTVTYRIIATALMAAFVFVGTFIRIPLGTSKVHVANAICVFAGFLLSPLYAGVAGGLGSLLFDIVAEGKAYESLVTFVTKFMIGFVVAVLYKLFKDHITKQQELKGEHTPLLYVISAAGSLTYTVLYGLKSFIWVLVGLVPAASLEGRTGLSAAWWWAIGKMSVSMLNAFIAFLVAPFLYWGIMPALKKMGVLSRLNPPTPE